MATLLFEQDVQLGDPQSPTAEILGQGDAEQSGDRQLTPEVAVHAVLGGLHLLDPVDARLARENLIGEGADRLLLFAEVEVHQCSSLI